MKAKMKVRFGGTVDRAHASQQEAPGFDSLDQTGPSCVEFA